VPGVEYPREPDGDAIIAPRRRQRVAEDGSSKTPNYATTRNIRQVSRNRIENENCRAGWEALSSRQRLVGVFQVRLGVVPIAEEYVNNVLKPRRHPFSARCRIRRKAIRRGRRVLFRMLRSLRKCRTFIRGGARCCGYVHLVRETLLRHASRYVSLRRVMSYSARRLSSACCVSSTLLQSDEVMVSTVGARRLK
jgi:hypothetical protein